MSTPAVDVALTAELDKLGDGSGPAPVDEAPAPAKGRRKSRSGTSGAARARRAKEAGDKPAAARTPRSRATKPKIGEGMARMYAMAGVGVAMVPSGPAVAGPGAAAGQSVTGVVGMQLVAESVALGAAWKAAAEDPRIREALERLLAVSTVGAIVAAHLPIVMHGLVAAGVAPPAIVGHAEAPAAPAPAPAPGSDSQDRGGRP